MTLHLTRNQSLASFQMPRLADTSAVMLSSTMMGGTALFDPGLGRCVAGTGELSEYVAVKIEEILEYERTILELQRELLHYKRLVAKGFSKPEGSEEYLRPEVPLDAASVRVVDSILAASAPGSATFTDFDEEEL